MANEGGSRAWVVVAAGVGVLLVAVAVMMMTLRRDRPSSGPAVASRPATAPAVAVSSNNWVEASDRSSDVVASYVADFKRGCPEEFSAGDIHLTAKDKRPYLGRFNATGVQFAIGHAPPHRFVRVVFDLAVLNSWNGSSRRWGPDVLNVRVIGGPELLNATFCNCGFFGNNNEQSYPDTFPTPPGAHPHPAWTGAAEQQTLGETKTFKNADPIEIQDTSSVYRMDWVFPHDGDTLAIDFTAAFKNKAMRFGLLGFRVEALDKPAALTSDRLAAAWDALMGKDPVAADRAVWQLTAVPEQAIALIASHVSDLTGPSISPYGKSRVTRVLRVINTPESLSLADKAS